MTFPRSGRTYNPHEMSNIQLARQEFASQCTVGPEGYARILDDNVDRQSRIGIPGAGNDSTRWKDELLGRPVIPDHSEIRVSTRSYPPDIAPPPYSFLPATLPLDTTTSDYVAKQLAKHVPAQPPKQSLVPSMNIVIFIVGSRGEFLKVCHVAEPQETSNRISL